MEWAIHALSTIGSTFRAALHPLSTIGSTFRPTFHPLSMRIPRWAPRQMFRRASYWLRWEKACPRGQGAPKENSPAIQ